MKDGPISLLFSGGADSTLSAGLLAARYRKINLVTFKHYATWRVSSSSISEARLKAVFPRIEFTHVYLNSTRLFLKLQKRIFQDISEYPFLNHYFCGACKLAMHSALIAYNLNHGIKNAASGASRLMPMFPDQTPGGELALEELYGRYGMTYENPVFDLHDVDKKAAALGLLDAAHLKVRHKADFSRTSDLLVPFRNVLDNIQGFCLLIAFIDPYLTLARREYSNRDISALSLDYYRRSIAAICVPWIEAQAPIK
ncbi:MAG TPA: hypothetical protein DEB40_02915 [Elusimicrobia bacterium]|nr:hypothetical protein [Elusimicrobiota bacterium]HBT60682.1 hypothetical protein [Elusimicrobiota bacterium]